MRNTLFPSPPHYIGTDGRVECRACCELLQGNCRYVAKLWTDPDDHELHHVVMVPVGQHL